MKNIDKLIFLYCYICDCYDRELSLHYQRMSNNYLPQLTDQEVLTIFFYCLLVEKRMSIRTIYDFADNYLRTWFPHLGKTYESFLVRLNNLIAVFPALIHCLLEQKSKTMNPEELKQLAQMLFSVVDSMPIIMAKGPRSFTAKVAPNLADKGFCSSKKLHYYGLKLHVMGFSRFQKLPLPEFVGTSPASHNDLTVFKPLLENIQDRVIFGDKIYGNQQLEQWLEKNNNVHILTPVKKNKGQVFLEAADKFYSTIVSQVRLPIESFFNWIIEKTGIQNASKVRSEKGLLLHVYGRFAAAMFSLTFEGF